MAVVLILAMSVSVTGRAELTTAELDSLLLGGQGLVLAFEDTLAFDPATNDTLLVTAPRVTVGEVIEAIGRKMERDAYRMREYAYTALVTVIVRKSSDPGGGPEGGDYEIHESATRHHMGRDEGHQRVELWSRTRKFKDGELDEEEQDQEVRADWVDMPDPVLDALPFMPGSGQRYEYEIVGRDLVGNSLIYQVRFAPKSRFEALPSGTVWVDYSNWVIRKIEASMIGAVPYPLFIESIPVYRMSQERFGDFWFVVDTYFRLELRALPLVGMPENFELKVELQDIQINGIDFGANGEPLPDPVPVAPVSTEKTYKLTGGAAAPRDSLEAWEMSPEDSAEALTAFWSDLDGRWAQDVPSVLGPISLHPDRLDSLLTVGDEQLRKLRAGGLWGLEFDLLEQPLFNRVQGPVLRASARLRQLGPDRPELKLLAGYGFSNRRPVFGAQVRLPLIVRHWTLPGGRMEKGARYQLLSLLLSGRKDAALFAGDGRRVTRAFTSAVYGSDPNHYYEDRRLEGWLNLRTSRHLVLAAGGGLAEHRALAQQTDWNLVNRELHPDGNIPAADLDDRFYGFGMNGLFGPLSVSGKATWHGVTNSEFAGGYTGAETELIYRRLELGAGLEALDGLGNRWALRGDYRNVDKSAPPQWRTWLGDFGTLRGYPAGELNGDVGTWASIDVRLNFDLWRSLRFPLLKKLGLQPIVFADWGKTRNQNEGVLALASSGVPRAVHEFGGQGSRLDAGVGFGRRLDLPGFGKDVNLRIFAAKPLDEANSGRNWRYLVAFVK